MLNNYDLSLITGSLVDFERLMSNEFYIVLYAIVSSWHFFYENPKTLKSNFFHGNHKNKFFHKKYL